MHMIGILSGTSLLHQLLYLVVFIDLQILKLRSKQKVEILYKLLIVRQLLLFLLCWLWQKFSFSFLQIVFVSLKHSIVKLFAVHGTEVLLTSAETVQTELFFGCLQRNALGLSFYDVG